MYTVSFLNTSSFQLETEYSNELVKHIIGIYMNFLLRGSIAIFGTITNSINMVIFYKLGLKDSMSVGLLALSFTDFLISFVCVSAISYIIWDKYFPDTVVHPLSLENVSFGWARDLLFLCSGWITAFLSIERCVCVTFPFKVRQIFTRVRCVIIIVIIYIVHMAVYSPIFASHWLQWTKIEMDNGTGTVFVDRLVVTYSKNRRQVMLFSDIATGAVLPVPSQALVLISVIWMIHGLRMSSRIRGSGTVSKSNGSTDDKKMDRLSSKERRLVKVMLFLAIILTVCNIPRFLGIYAKQVNPEIAYAKRYAHIHTFLWTLAILACTVNSSVNIFVYLTINASYRAKFREMFFRCGFKIHTTE